MIQDRQTAWVNRMEPMPCTYHYFTAFELELDRNIFARPFAFATDVFVYCLFERSAKLPLKCGHDSLLRKAAVDFVELVKPYALEFYRDRGRVLDWNERDYADLAIEVADRMQQDQLLKARTKLAMKSKRNQLYVDDATIAQSNAQGTAWHPHLRNNGSNYKIFMRNSEVETEEPIESFVRTLDYIEHISHLPAYADLFTVKRVLTSYLRVGRSVFEHWR